VSSEVQGEVMDSDGKLESPPNGSPARMPAGNSITGETIMDTIGSAVIQVPKTIPVVVFKGYAWEGHWHTDTQTFVGYDEVMAFIRDEVEKNNAIEFCFWVSSP